MNNKVVSAAAVYMKDGKVFVSGKFIAKPADYQVKIPKIVTRKIAENVNVDYNFELIKP